jgi:hypothetical protein
MRCSRRIRSGLPILHHARVEADSESARPGGISESLLSAENFVRDEMLNSGSPAAAALRPGSGSPLSAASSSRCRPRQAAGQGISSSTGSLVHCATTTPSVSPSHLTLYSTPGTYGSSARRRVSAAPPVTSWTPHLGHSPDLLRALEVGALDWQAWEEAMPRARQDHADQFHRERLREQVARFAEAEIVRSYCTRAWIECSGMNLSRSYGCTPNGITQVRLGVVECVLHHYGRTRSQQRAHARTGPRQPSALRRIYPSFETMLKLASASLDFQGAPPRDADHHRGAHRHATGAVAVSQEVSALRASAILE